MSKGRILSQHGNVIAADFRPRDWEKLTVQISWETLFIDGHVTLIRVTTTFEGKPCGSPMHLLADLASGAVVHLNSQPTGTKP